MALGTSKGLSGSQWVLEGLDGSQQVLDGVGRPCWACRVLLGLAKSVQVLAVSVDFGISKGLSMSLPVWQVSVGIGTSTGLSGS